MAAHSRVSTPPPPRPDDGPRQRRQPQQLDGEDAPEASRSAVHGRPRREFGDHMALEGETSNIASIMLLYYLAILLYSLLASRVCGTGPWTMCLYYLAGMVAFYVWHLMAHSKWTGKMNDLHMRHHVYTYPPGAFYGRTPTTIREELGKDCPTLLDLLLPNKTITMKLEHEGPLYLFMALILAAGYFIFESTLPTLGMVLALYVAMGLIGNAMHMSFHVKNFELERYAWYRELRTLHYLHHLGDMKSNLAMINLGMDGAMGSLAVSVDSLNHSAATRGMQSSSGLAELVEVAELPYGITRELLHTAKGSAGLLAASLGFDLPLDLAQGHSKLHRPAIKRGLTTVLVRIIVVMLCNKAWRSALDMTTDSSYVLMEQQQLLGEGAALSDTEVTDLGQRWMAQHVTPVVLSSPAIAAAACDLSDIITNFSLVLLAVFAVAGTSFRPFLSVMIANIIRHVIHQVGPVPSVSPGVSMWVASGQGTARWIEMVLPSSNPTAFFSIRVCVSVISLTELLMAIAPESQNAFDALRRVFGVPGAARMLIAALGYLNVAFQVVLALCLRSSFTFDIIIAFVVGRYSTLFASMYCASFLDAFMP